MKESWRSNDDDDGEEGSEREDRVPARVRNHGVDVPPPISAAWCATSAWRDLWDETNPREATLWKETDVNIGP